MSNIIKIHWNEVDWKKIESRVFRIQRRIYKAKTDKKVNAVHYLQKKIIVGFQEKLMSIREASKTHKFYWIKTIYINTTTNNIKVVYISSLRKTLSFDLTTVENLKKRLLTSEPLLTQLIKNGAKQYLIKLALEPEWASKFEIYSMGHNLGQNYQDTLENIFSKQILNSEYSFQKNLFEGFKNFNIERFIKKLNTIKIIKLQIKKWLEFNTFSFGERNLPFYTELNFEKGQKNLLMPLLWDIAFSGMETYLTHFITDKIKKWSGDQKIKYFRYLNQILILSEDLNTLHQIILVCHGYLNKIGSYTNITTSKVSKTTSGIDFLGFQIVILKRKNQFQKKISISKGSKKFLLAKTRFIIQKNKSVSSYILIKKLNPSILFWGKYFQYCECKKDFLQVDNRILNQLRAWVFRRKAAGKNRTFLKEKYFPSNKVFTYEDVQHKESWVLSGEKTSNNNSKIHNFLPKLAWIKKRKYVAVKNNNSIYNGNYLYWSKRLTNLENEQRLILQKQFLVEGKIEIYNYFIQCKKLI